jgi:hypothetical protein
VRKPGKNEFKNQIGAIASIPRVRIIGIKYGGRLQLGSNIEQVNKPRDFRIAILRFATANGESKKS